MDREGIIVINKPTGMTSHDVVNRLRRKFRMRRIGHAGTLDPLATGVLVMLLGKATKLFSKFEGFDKAYKATLILGIKTTTADIQGKELEHHPIDHIRQQDVENVFGDYRGDIEQLPPMVSAVKVNGRRLYELARKGVEVKRKPRKITIYDLELISFEPPRVRFFLECSKGTYVRQLAEDVGERLECGACIAEIQRTQVGPFRIEEAVSLDEANESHIRSWQG